MAVGKGRIPWMEAGSRATFPGSKQVPMKLPQWLKDHSVLLCMAVSMVLVGVAIRLYPGGSLADPHSVGFDWTRNFFSNLFLPKALNGAENPGRSWAVIGMAFHSLAEGIFFLRAANKMPSRHAALVLRIIGAANIAFNFLIATPLHDPMVTVSSTLGLLGLFYITVFVLKSKRHGLKVLCVACMLVFYFTLFLYGWGNWGLLAIMQKVSALCSMSLVLVVEYFTTREDFVPAPAVASGPQFP